MGFELDFELAISSCCDQVEFCDTTGIMDPVNPTSVCNGYGVDDNPTVYDVARTECHWVFPDGSIYQNVDVGFVPGKPAYASFKLTAGTSGGVVIKINNVTAGYGILTPSMTLIDLSNDVVNSINALSYTTGFVAIFDSNTLVITVRSQYPGLDYNNKVIDIFTSGDVTASNNSVITSNGTGDDDCSCKTWTLYDIIGANCPSGYPKFQDGVYSVTYIIYDSDNKEIARITKQFFFDCNVKGCFKSLLLMVAKECPCEDKDLAVRIANVRNKIEAANEMFCAGDYACANDMIQDAGDACSDFCTNCP